ncbi:MAG: PIN-like domain-containing protein [Saprospiraceae bacterium]|nr:PIN-like domain-containing protein [Saprospiraceae bacterium]
MSVSYLDKINKGNSSLYSQLLGQYRKDLERIEDLFVELPIFLDTNVLLRYYTDPSTRKGFSTFFIQNLASIYLSHQVEIEFSLDERNTVEKLFKGILYYRQEIPEDDTKWEAFEHKNVLGTLGRRKIEQLKKEFNSLVKTASNREKSKRVFPGMGDSNRRFKYPYGDFIIFHEMMYFAKEEQKDVLFLTYDTTKGDWLRKSGNVHAHYVENFYLNTGQMLYILDANSILKKSRSY